jgi:bile acid:Na+ symporter, BASS family
MLSLLTDYGVPAAIALLMLIAGTELRFAHIAIAFAHPRALLAGTIGQLALLPPLALLIDGVSSPVPTIAAGTLLLALSPGGGISNYYCYLARRNVSLSASITAAGTLLSLVTIPMWMTILPAVTGDRAVIPTVPVATILLQLLVLMILPMAGGMLLRGAFPEQIERQDKLLRLISIGFVLLVLFLAMLMTRATLAAMAPSILLTASLFIMGAMLCGWMLGYGLGKSERPVLVIESGVRNIGVALILSRSVLASGEFGQTTSFFAGYFAVEIVVMLVFANILASRGR